MAKDARRQLLKALAELDQRQEGIIKDLMGRYQPGEASMNPLTELIGRALDAAPDPPAIEWDCVLLMILGLSKLGIRRIEFALEHLYDNPS